ncbi:hypothetical protein ACX8Z9_00520 [Arthrobacter halodurans]|uniref:Uncharacterized protein n=1 Tax=Arthrobacter halodurans TaxID=516699 RepID=A0ABV4ULS2_9MICC
MLAILLGAAALVTGIGQQTFWAPPATLTATVPAPLEDAPVTVIEPGISAVHGDPVEVTIRGDGEFVAALGRSADVDAWVGEAAHNTVSSVDAENQVLVAEHTDGEATVPDPGQSDLWVATETFEGQLEHQWTEPADGQWSLLLAADGTEAAPTDITVTWPNDAGTPFAVPLVIGGSLLLVLGLVLAALAARGGRGRGHGHGTSAPVGPETAGAPTAAAGPHNAAGPHSAAGPNDGPATQAAPVSASTPHGRRGESGGASGATVLRGAAVAVAAALILSPALSASASTGPSPSGSAEPAPAAEPGDRSSDVHAVLLDVQLEGILDSIAETVADGDAAKDAKKLQSRVGGRALELRETNYGQRADGIKVAAPAAVGAGPVLSAAVTTTTDWPRTVTVVTKAEKATVPQVLVLKQQSPRSNYKLVSSVSMLPGSEFPGIAVGDPSVTTATPHAKGLVTSPASAAARLGEVLTKPGSDHSDLFADSVFIKATHEGQSEVQKSNKDADIWYSRRVDDKRTTAMRTPDGGAIVTAYYVSTMSAEPKQKGGTVRLDSVSAKLAGASTTKEQASLSYGESVVFYIPAAGGKDKIRLVAGDVALLSAKVAG